MWLNLYYLICDYRPALLWSQSWNQRITSVTQCVQSPGGCARKRRAREGAAQWLKLGDPRTEWLCRSASLPALSRWSYRWHRVMKKGHGLAPAPVDLWWWGVNLQHPSWHNVVWLMTLEQKMQRSVVVLTRKMHTDTDYRYFMIRYQRKAFVKTLFKNVPVVERTGKWRAWHQNCVITVYTLTYLVAFLCFLSLLMDKREGQFQWLRCLIIGGHSCPLHILFHWAIGMLHIVSSTTRCIGFMSCYKK